ncbi:hypothetical protein [Streptomyces sp. NBC_01506]|uniref:hypothetical protein n=1 Tax=Streptomyces sp. NBC_01506 TaxID=2903887 RepID=UPI00386C98A6
MAHQRDTWLDHVVAESLLRGRPVETTDIRAQERADRLARVLEEAAHVPDEGSAELPGEAAALAAYRQAVGTAGRTASVDGTAVDGMATVRLGPERRGGRFPSFGRPLRLGVVAAVAGCAVSGVAAGAGYLYAPSAGDSPQPPASSVSDAVTPEPLVSESPDGGSPPAGPHDTPGGTVPGATGSHTTTGASGGAADGDKERKGEASSGGNWKEGDRENWYAKLVQACNDHRDGTIAAEKKSLLEDAAEGPQGVTGFCDRLLSDDPDDPDDDEHHEGAPSYGYGGNGGGSGGGGVDSPQSEGPSEGPSEGGNSGGTDGGSEGGTDGGSNGGSEGPPIDWPGGDYGETIGVGPPEPDSANPPPLLPAVPGANSDSGESAAPTP